MTSTLCAVFASIGRTIRHGSRLGIAIGMIVLCSQPVITVRAQQPGHSDGPKSVPGRSDLHEKSGLTVTVTFPSPYSVIDEDVTPSVPVNIAIASATPLATVTAFVCETLDNASCSNALSTFSLPITAPYQAIWVPPSIGNSTTVSSKYRVWSSARNSSGESVTSESTLFTYIRPSDRSIKLLAPARDTGFIAPATPILWASFVLHAGDPAKVVRVEFLDGPTVIGTVATPNSTPSGFAFAWANAPQGVHEISARGVDSLGHISTTPPVSLYIVSPPGSITVSLSQPHTGQLFAENAPIPLSAIATAIQGSVERVEFVDGATVIATAYDPPYNATWMAPSLGYHAISARAFDDLGNASASSAAYVRSLSWPRPPLVVMSAPTQGTTIASKTPIGFASLVEAPEAGISHVDYWVDGSVVGTATSQPFAFLWTTASAGPHQSAAVAYDAKGRSATSPIIKFQVTGEGAPPAGPTPPAQPPVVTLTSPLDNSNFVEGQVVPLAANATQSNGTITRIDFAANGGIVASTKVPPWGASWSPSPGHYVLTAIATDSNGNTATSKAVGTSVTPLPTAIVLATVAPGASYYPGDAIGLRPASMRVTGAVARIEYYVDGAMVGMTTRPPYVFEWDVDAPGNHSAFARVYDTAGNTAASDPIQIAVRQLAVQFTSPTDASTVDGAGVLAEGTYEGPANTGIVVNGVIAINDGNGHFYVNDVPLPKTSNMLIATATSLGGSRVSASIMVNANPETDASGHHIATSGMEGIDSLTLRIIVDNPADIESYRFLDLNGGTMGAGVAGSENIATLTFNAPGTYQPTIEVTDKQNRVTRKKVVLRVASAVETVSSQMAVVAQFTDALSKQKKARALATLTGGLAIQFSGVYDALQDQWPGIIASMGPIGATMYGTGNFEAAVARDRGGQRFLYLIEGMRDSDGVWRIDSF